jgi:formylglycine-generating enzyme required for sulfatase activity
VAWLLFTTKAVRVEIDPAPDRVAFEGGWMGWELAGRHLLRPGTYTLVAEKQGFRRLEETIEVTGAQAQRFAFAMEKLPGLLVIDTGNVQGAVVSADGSPVGGTPGEPIELEEGEHTIRVEADRHRPFVTQVSIEGSGQTQTLTVELVPLWAPVSFDSSPAGATVLIDGDLVGRTPLSTSLPEGRHDFELGLEGHKTHRGSVKVTANEPTSVPRVKLAPADARLVLNSDPPGASVTVGEEYRGRTPLDIDLAPGRTHRIEVLRSGYDAATREVLLEAGETEELSIALTPRLGEVEFVTLPGGAELLIDGGPRGPASQVLQLVAVPHRIEVRKEGYEPFRIEVTPRPGFPQTVRVELKTAEEIRAEAVPAAIRTRQGQELILIDGGRFGMGAPRREPGRRANETLREVELTRRHYMATMEVTNEQFHEFRDSHLSGRAGPVNLEIGNHPVVRVSWEEAALYCNWLSREEGLPEFYLDTGGAVVAREPFTTGYRLPTEAEWAWAARYPDGAAPLKYPWGQSMPVAKDSGNYADESAQTLLSATLQGYDDRFAATAPVDSFPPNPLGLFNVGGNVAEWVHDVYTVYRSGDGKVESDPTGPREGEFHVIRGSSWMDASMSELRLTYRDRGREPRADVGFRIARYAE